MSFSPGGPDAAPAPAALSPRRDEADPADQREEARQALGDAPTAEDPAALSLPPAVSSPPPADEGEGDQREEAKTEDEEEKAEDCKREDEPSPGVLECMEDMSTEALLALSRVRDHLSPEMVTHMQTVLTSRTGLREKAAQQKTEPEPSERDSRCIYIQTHAYHTDEHILISLCMYVCM